MGIHLRNIVRQATKFIQQRVETNISASNHLPQRRSAPVTVPKGHFAVYIGEKERKRLVVPVSYLKHPLFQDLLNRAEEEFDIDHQTGGVTLPYAESDFLKITSRLNSP